jgi:hypothetical protein
LSIDGQNSLLSIIDGSMRVNFNTQFRKEFYLRQSTNVEKRTKVNVAAVVCLCMRKTIATRSHGEAKTIFSLIRLMATGDKIDCEE